MVSCMLCAFSGAAAESEAHGYNAQHGSGRTISPAGKYASRKTKNVKYEAARSESKFLPFFCVLVCVRFLQQMSKL